MRRLFGVTVLLLLIPLGFSLYDRYHPNRPEDYASIEEHFKYGSIGSENDLNGPPYWIWKVLPDLFPEKLPGEGYASLGFVFEEKKDRPIGTSLRRHVIDQLGFNCAVCHTGTLRESPSSRRRIILGMPANTFDLQAYFRFLQASVLDGRFTADNVVAAIQSKKRLNFIERFIYRQAVFRTRETLLDRGQKLGFMDCRPEWGPGRVDTFNPYKTIQFAFPMDRDATVGTTDLPSIWNQKPRQGMQLHWDGNNTSVEERNKSAALGAGVTPPSIDLARIKRIEDWLWLLPAPAYPFPIDSDRAARGEALYRERCASCHDFGASQTGKVLPIDLIGTDRGRLDSFTWELAVNMNTLYAGYPYRFTHFRKTNGYANVPLDGIWLRAPYLHNGSVPTLRDLLRPPAERPKVFYRGYDVYDQKNVGFVSDVAQEGERRYFRLDTALPGNGNGGHLYGTELTNDEKEALVEYLKKR